MASAQLDEFEWMSVMWLDEEAKSGNTGLHICLLKSLLPELTLSDPASVEWPKIRKRSVHPELAVLSKDRHCG